MPPPPKLSKLELRVMEALWKQGPCSVREVQESFPARRRPAYTTVQTVIYRLEDKKAVRRTKKIGNAHIFEPIVSRAAAHRRLFDDLLSLFGGRAQPLISHLIESGKLTLEDIEEARETLRELQQRDSSESKKE
jgi:BlaI family transcriptional regulator, penicillinase repressor